MCITVYPCSMVLPKALELLHKDLVVHEVLVKLEKALALTHAHVTNTTAPAADLVTDLTTPLLASYQSVVVVGRIHFGYDGVRTLYIGWKITI